MTRHPSEQPLGHLQNHHSRRGKVIRLHRNGTPRYQAVSSPDGPSLGELAAGVFVFLLWGFALLWAMPVIFTAVMEGGVR